MPFEFDYFFYWFFKFHYFLVDLLCCILFELLSYGFIALLLTMLHFMIMRITISIP